MVANPGLALTIGLAMLLVLTLLVWPQWGLFARLKRARRQSLRIQVEDGLKHLYDYEYRGLNTSLDSLSGALSLKRDNAVPLADRLIQLKLIVSDGPHLRLTGEGRSYALRVIRVHRLWERYLSEETAVRETEWHERAEEKEHLLSPQEAETLARRLGHPVLDPHGDPIPTAAGTVPPPRGTTLNRMEAGSHGVIVHIEDEPSAIYAQLVAQGLHLGLRLRVLEQGTDRVLIESEGNEIMLAPMNAANVSIVPVESALDRAETHRTLATLQRGEEAVVSSVSGACRGLQRRRLLDLGLVPGSRIRAEMVSATGDPTAYRVRGATIALRRQQAEWIYVESVKERDA